MARTKRTVWSSFDEKKRAIEELNMSKAQKEFRFNQLVVDHAAMIAARALKE